MKEMALALHFITASTSGNTEYVADTIVKRLKIIAPDISIEMQKAELTKPEDLLRGDVLILGSGIWNTGGKEGQLNMHMDALLKQRAKDIDLQKKPITFISLGDDRYYFRTRCTEHFLRYQREHNGVLIVPPIILVNEPYGQEERINTWTDKLNAVMSTMSK
jgi:flavodoxin